MAINEIEYGLYEKVIDQELGDLLKQLEHRQFWTEKIDVGESHNVLAQHFKELIARTLSSLPQENRLAHQVALANRIVAVLSEHGNGAIRYTDKSLPDASRLLEVATDPSPLNRDHAGRPE